MPEVNLDELRKGAVSDIVKGLGALSDAELDALASAEAGSHRPRTTLTGAIASEQEGRKATAAAETAAKIKAEAAEHGVVLYTQADVDGITADHDKRLKRLEGKLEKAVETAQPVSEKLRTLALAGKADGALVRIAFTDAGGNTFAGLPDLKFDESAFARDPADKTLTLRQPIAFPESVRRFDVAKVWLLGDNGEAAACVSLVSPLPVGGGTTATIPAGHLAFHLPAPPSET